MKALVTGATGFIGGNLARTLVHRDYDVRVLVRPESNPLALQDLPVETVPGDLRDRDSLAKPGRLPKLMSLAGAAKKAQKSLDACAKTFVAQAIHRGSPLFPSPVTGEG